jgi:hypothetical protein
MARPDASSVLRGAVNRLTGQLADLAAATTGLAVASFTPTLLNPGSPAAHTVTGEWCRLGPLAWISLTVSMTSAGSGAGIIGIGGLPFTPDRSVEQVISAVAEAITTGDGNSSAAIVLSTGSGAQIDRIRNPSGNITGAQLQGGATPTILRVTGWLRHT